jgi:hypothetical protein
MSSDTYDNPAIQPATLGLLAEYERRLTPAMLRVVPR